MIHTHISKYMFMYFVAVAIMITDFGCSQGPVSNQETDDLKSEIKDIRQHLTQLKSDLSELIAFTDENKVQSQATQMRDELESMKVSLANIEEALETEQPRQTPPGGTAPGGAAPGAGGAAPPARPGCSPAPPAWERCWFAGRSDRRGHLIRVDFSDLH